MYCLLGYEVQCRPDGTTNSMAYGYTPCMNYAYCSGTRYQAVYFSQQTGACSYALAPWDDGALKPKFRYNRDGDNIYSWTFEYKQQVVNGDSCSNNERKFDIIWKCDATSTPFSIHTTCGMTQTDNPCHHEMTIMSAYACAEGVEEGSESSQSGLSTGGLILILGLVAFILYCAIGYTISVLKQEKEERDYMDIKGHTPQWSFWTYGLCAYTKAGCCVTYEYLNAKMGQKSDDDIGETDYTLDDDEYE